MICYLQAEKDPGQRILQFIDYCYNLSIQMQESKRRKSNYRQSERKHEFSSLINRMIVDSNEFALRESLNPMTEEHLFNLISSDRRLSTEALTSLLKIVQKQVLIIGFILPAKLLTKCWQLLTGSRQANLSPKNINCAILTKSMLANTSTILFMIEESEVLTQQRPNILEKIIINLSFVLVTTTKVIQKRISQWESQQFLLDKYGGLLMIKEDGVNLYDEIIERVQSLFWNFDAVTPQQLENKPQKAMKDNFLMPQRQAYQQMNEDDEENGLKSRLNLLAEMSLKRNWKISQGLLCYPFLYLLNIWLSDDQRDPRQLLENSLMSYCKSLEEEFLKFIQNFKLPLDELKFRNSIETQEKQMLFNAHKHLNMLETIFPKFEMACKSLEGLEKYFNQKANDLYEANNNLASKLNATLLEKLYEEIINKKFQTEGTSRTIDSYQNDFRQLLEVYGSQSFRVSSQLKTFNEFLIDKKIEYAQNLGKELQGGSKKYYSEKQQLQDRLEIQTGVLETLQTELKELQQKRKKIDFENSLLKTTISDNCKKRQVELISDNNTGSRKNYFQQTDRKTARYQSKALTKSKQSAKKASKCCCQIM